MDPYIDRPLVARRAFAILSLLSVLKSVFTTFTARGSIGILHDEERAPLVGGN